jgi:Transglycosylase SLT domain
MGLTSLVTLALLGGAGAASGQDVAQEGGGEASAAGVDVCPSSEAGGDDASTDQASERCPDPDKDGAGGTEPSPDPSPQSDPSPAADPSSEPAPAPAPEPAPEPEPAPAPQPSPPPATGGGTDQGDPASGDTPGGAHGAAGPGGRGGRARGGRQGGHESHGNGSGGVPAGGGGDEPHGHASDGVSAGGSGGAAAAPGAADFAPAAVGGSGADLGEFAIPSFLVPIYQQCGERYGIPWEVLAAINRVETAFGSNLNVSSAGAVGWMQFLPSSWSTYGVDASQDGRSDPYDPKDAICAAGRYLRAAGGQEDLRRAIFAYNHADWYVDLVLGYAHHYAALYRPDPLPPASRLDRDFARSLARISRENEVDWAKVLAILRARGDSGETPTAPDEMRTVARSLARAEAKSSRWRLVRRQVLHDPRLEQQVAALTRYNRAVGLPGLVKGLNAVKDRLEQRVLDSQRIDVYEGGRQDIAAGRVDVRVLTLLLYLAEKYDGVTVTSLVTGHGYYARPGVPSLHAFGRAVDIAALRGIPILGNQEPGGITEQALHDILLLPKELQPTELISLLDLGGPSFAAADHDDHIHVGF